MLVMQWESFGGVWQKNGRSRVGPIGGPLSWQGNDEKRSNRDSTVTPKQKWAHIPVGGLRGQLRQSGISVHDKPEALFGPPQKVKIPFGKRPGNALLALAIIVQRFRDYADALRVVYH